MGPIPLWKRALYWLSYQPVALAYRIIWLTAKLGSGNARDVHAAMWDANLAVPPLTAQQAKPTGGPQ